MLYVFHVDAGTMSTFDMNIALQSVANLKQAIERKTKIPANSLVLLVSGGEVLQGDQKVSSYSAGTDTNPIFMFSKPSIRDEVTRQAPQYSVDYDCDLSPISDLSPSVEMRCVVLGSELKAPADMKPLVEACCSLPPCHTTVAKCAQLAQQFADIAIDFARSCQQLVHDQHLQHQGWAAVVANLEDIYSDFCERSIHFKDSFKRHRQKKEKYHQDLMNINTVLQELGQIPMLAALQVNAEAHRFTAFDEFDDGYELGGNYSHMSERTDGSENKGLADFGAHVMISQDDVFPVQKASEGSGSGAGAESRLNESDEGVTFKAHSYDGQEQYTLLHWILAKGNKASLDDIIDYCKKGLHLMETDPSKESEVELYKMLEFANAHGLKQIKGIENRLYGLEQLMAQARKLEKEQIELANALIQNRERVSAVSDPSVLPTLCSSHRLHLHSMLKNHESLLDLQRRIAKSKDELSIILKARLGAVLKIENLMSKQDAHYMLNFQCFNRLARYFDVVEQLHRAPELFAHAVHEVARRRLFSEAFLQWASELACHLLTIHNDEVVRRQEFNSQFHGHFLSALFPGTEDLPPTYASQAPQDFDERLPKLSDVDVEFVTKTFPELTKDINKCNMESVVEFFKSRMGPSAKFGEKEKGLTEMVQAGLERGFDSETETGDAEKPSGVKCQADVSVVCCPDTAVVSTITEETMDTHRAEIDKLSEFLINLYKLCRTSIVLMQAEMSRLRSDVEEQRQFVHFQCSEVLSAWARGNEETAQRTREEIQKLTIDHELEMSDIKKVLTEKDDTISGLHSDINILKKEHLAQIEMLQRSHDETKSWLKKSHEDYNSLEKRIEELDVKKQRDMKELQDKMHLEYKAEIESLRSRFRLVALTNMDRSPSESSLEKIERTDMIEISSHNAIVQQTKENMEVEKEEAVKEAVERCEREWQHRYSEQRSKYESDKQVTLNETVRRIIDEKDRQLDQFRERETNLMRECTKYKDTIQQLADPETNDYETLLKTQLATLENEKAMMAARVDELQRELEKRISEEKDAEKPIDEDTDASSKSPPRKEGREERQWSRSRGPRTHTPLGVTPGTLNLSSCLPGHTVMLLWDPAHHNYTVLQEAPVMYFVHSDCLPALDLSISAKSDNDRKLYSIATVESKEYCYAKKSSNRYHVPRGTRFYRVRVKPCRTAAPACCELRHARSHDIQKSQDTSQSTSTETSEVASKEVVTAVDLIDLSPAGGRPGPAAGAGRELEESTSECMEESTVLPCGGAGEDCLDSIETSTVDLRILSSRQSEMESSVAVAVAPAEMSAAPFPLDLPLELTVSTQSIVTCVEPHAAPAAAPAHTLSDLMESEIAEEATP